MKAISIIYKLVFIELKKWGTGKKSTGDTLARGDNLAWKDTLFLLT